MTAGLSLILSGLAAWLTGSIPFSLLIARWAAGIDLRQHGSGNVGATNVVRTLGWRWGSLALALDALKGSVPVLLLPELFPSPVVSPMHHQVLCGVLAILGHMYPPWLGFRGGKGVATGLGVVMVIAPLATFIAFVAFLIVIGLSKIVSLASMVAALTFSIAQLFLWGPGLWTPQNWSLGVFSVAVPVLILVRHRSNMVRLWKGQETQLRIQREPGPADAEARRDEQQLPSG